MTPAERIQDALKSPGKHSFGNSLFLITRPSGKGYWVQQYRDGISFRSKSLGTVADLNSYSKAVLAAKRFAVKRDDDEAKEEAIEAAGPLFSVLVAEYLDGYDRDGERVPGKAAGWRGDAEADAYRRNLIERGELAKMHVVKITSQDIAAHLRLLGKPKLAERVRSHTQNVMAFAIAREIRLGAQAGYVERKPGVGVSKGTGDHVDQPGRVVRLGVPAHPFDDPL